MSDLILASGSPRRKELLEQIGVCFEVVKVSVDETPLPDESPLDYVLRLAIEKADAGSQLIRHKKPVLGSDTTVVCNGKILGKPENKADALAMLKMLSGNHHQVITAVAVVKGQQNLHQIVTTDVTFRSLSNDEIEAYWHTGEPSDKAGAYGIQGLGGVFVENISGSYSAVVGLPLAQTAKLLKTFDVPVWKTL